MPAARFFIVSLQLEPASVNHERPGHPRGLEPQDAAAGRNRIANE
jgi:hypothetical protein